LKVRIIKSQNLNALAILLIIVLYGAVNAECQIRLGNVQTVPTGIKPNLSYMMIIDITSAAQHRAHVSIAISDIKTPSLILTMHTYHGHYPIPILNLNATNEKGERLTVEYSERNGRFWKIVTHYAKQVSLEYFVVFSVIRGGIQHLGYLGKNFGMSMAEWTFLVPHDLSVHGVEVKFKLPSGWKSYAPWVSLEPETYYSDSIGFFITSVYGLGDFDLFSRRLGDTDVSIAVYNEWRDETKEKIAQTSLKIFEYQSNLFGKSVMDRYLAIFSPVADDGMAIWGGEHSQSQGLSVRMPLDQTGFVSAMQWFSHQVFHRWNGWNPGGMSMQSDKEMWFCEGANVYYESKILLDLRIAAEHSVLRNLYDEYLNQYLGTEYDIPVTEAPKYWEPELGTENIWRYVFLIYSKGALICLLLDIEIRRGTNGGNTLDELMSYMYSQYGGMRGRYSNDDVARAIRSLTGRDFSNFFKQYVHGTERLPLDRHFTRTSLVKIDEVWKIGDTLSLSATLTYFDNRSIAGETVTFYMNSTPIATAMTDSQGLASANYIAKKTGKLEVTVVYLGTKDYTRLQSSDSSTITVRQIYSSISLNLPSAATRGQPAVIVAAVKDEVGRPIDKATVDFYVLTEGEWRRIGSTRTNIDGAASVVVMFNATGTFEVKASYAGDWKYSESAATRTLAVSTRVVSALPDQMFLFASLVAIAIVIALIGFLKASREKPTEVHSR